MDRSLTFVAVLTALVALTSPPAQCANIVLYCGVSSYSHRVPMWPLATALVDKGHNVTFISPYPAKNPNPKVHDFVPVKLKEWMEGWGSDFDMFEERKTASVLQNMLMGPAFGKVACEEIYKDEAFLKWMKETKVDLVFVDAVFNECGYGMAHYWKAKIMIFDTTTVFGWYSDSFGLPDETNWIPQADLFYSAHMTFLERAKNALLPVAWDLIRKWWYFPSLEKLTQETLGISDLPSFAEIENNISMVLMNTHYGEEFARSVSPNVVPIGGIAWVDKRKPLPKKMEDFLKKGSSGFIYLSFGTFADFTKLETSKQQAIIGAIRSFPQMQFVWKVSNESLIQEFPAGNVYIDKWMPQQDILSHPEIKAFITHSGLLGIQEAVYNAVPLIAFPIFAEQDYNAERIHRKEYGIRLEILTVTQEQLEDAINRILTDPKYKNNMKRVSTIFKDRPTKPLETALWWTDFVLRHSEDELVALRPLSIGQSWWKKRQLDVWLFIIGTIGISLAFSLYVLSQGLKYLCGGKSNAGIESRKKKIQ